MSTRAIIVHSLEHADWALSAASALGVPVTLRSAPGAHLALGATVFRDIVAEAARRHPDAAVSAVYDCGSDPGAALAALRHGLKAVRVDVDADIRQRIADIAGQLDAVVEDADADDGEVLDLLDSDDGVAAARRWLEGKA